MQLTARFAPILALGALAMLSGGCGSAPRRPDGGVGLLPVGSAAPEVTAYDVDGKAAHLGDFRGKPVVVYFYPKDGTPGCTKEACAFRDVWTRYEKAGVGVLGVSDDSREKHVEFQREHHLPFPLAADTDGTIGRGYGVTKGVFGYARVTFLVGKDGKIQQVWPNVDPGVHAAEVLAVAAPEAAGGTLATLAPVFVERA